MKRVNSDPDGREPDWEGLERLVRMALTSFTSTHRPDVVALRAQIDSVTIEEIDFTGHGFYAALSVPKVGPTLWAPTPFGALLGVATGGDELVALNLWLDKAGRIVCLEGANCGDVPFTARPEFTVELSELSQ